MLAAGGVGPGLGVAARDQVPDEPERSEGEAEAVQAHAERGEGCDDLGDGVLGAAPAHAADADGFPGHRHPGLEIHAVVVDVLSPDYRDPS